MIEWSAEPPTEAGWYWAVAPRVDEWGAEGETVTVVELSRLPEDPARKWPTDRWVVTLAPGVPYIGRGQVRAWWPVRLVPPPYTP